MPPAVDEIRRVVTVFRELRSGATEDGRVKLPHELDAATRAAVASFKIDEYGRIEYKFWDKNAALEKLFKHRGLYKVDNEQKTDPVAALVAAVLLGPLFYKVGINEVDFSSKLASPSWQHPMGTDDLGRDILARVLFRNKH